MSRRFKEESLDSRVDLLRKRIKCSEDLNTEGEVFDSRTLMDLYFLANKGVIDALGGPVSTGKEANVFRAAGCGGRLVLKIYRVSTSNFRAMQEYLQGDPRFGSVKGTKRAIVAAWAKKEFRNLKRAEAAGVRVPHPVAIRGNILVMELIGQDDEPAPQLKDVDLDAQEAWRVFGLLTSYVSLLYNRAGLVHADLSEFNILYDGEPVLIDMGQSVTLDHPMAGRFLQRDVANLARYFARRYGVGSEEEIWARIRGVEWIKEEG